LIHKTVRPQYTNVTDRHTDRTDNGPIAQGEPFYKQLPKKLCSLKMFVTMTVATSHN